MSDFIFSMIFRFFEVAFLVICIVPWQLIALGFIVVFAVVLWLMDKALGTEQDEIIIL